MKQLIDLIQIALQTAFAPAACIAVALLTMQAYKAARQAMRDSVSIIQYARKYLLKASLWNLVAMGCISVIVFFNRIRVSDGLQWIEQEYVNPVYFSADTSSAAVYAYERELQRYTSPAEFSAVVAETKRIAASVGSTPLSFYEVYYSECGMNPYALNTDSVYQGGRFIRVDTVACGIIQFTRAGVSGLMLDGILVTFRAVLDARNRRDIAYMMRLTDTYISRAASGHALPRSCDVYTAVYMPAYVGGGDDQVLASLYSAKPEYYTQNIGLDGYRLMDNGKILCLRQYRDGKITIGDLALCLSAKKGRLLSKYGTL